MGATAPTPPLKCLLGLFLQFFWPVDMRKGILQGIAKLETTPIMPQKALFCNSPLRNDNIPIQDMHTHKPLCSALLMQRFVSQIAFRETAQEQFCSATKRFIVTYSCIAKCHKALRNARVKQRTPGQLGHWSTHPVYSVGINSVQTRFIGDK